MAAAMLTLGRVSPLLQRIRDEYAALPGLRLTRAQFIHLYHTEPDECESAIRILVTAGFLKQDDHGQFCRSLDGLA